MNAINTNSARAQNQRTVARFNIQTIHDESPGLKTKHSISAPLHEAQNANPSPIDEHAPYQDSLLREMLYFDRF